MKKHLFVIVAFFLGIVVLVPAVIFLPTAFGASAPYGQCQATESAYDQIESGMTLDQIRHLLNCDGLSDSLGNNVDETIFSANLGTFAVVFFDDTLAMKIFSPDDGGNTKTACLIGGAICDRLSSVLATLKHEFNANRKLEDCLLSGRTDCIPGD